MGAVFTITFFSPIFGAGNDVIAIAGSTRDVTEQREITETLQKSEQHISLAQESSSFVGTWDWHVEENRVVADARFAELFNVDVDKAAVGAPIEDFIAAIHPDDVESHVQASIEYTLQHGGDFSEEYRLIQKNGSIVWVLARGYGYKNAAGKVSRFTGIAVNMTAQREAAEALRESERQFRMLADFMPQHIWTARADGSLDYSNERCRNYTGLSHSRDYDWISVVHPEDLPEAMEKWTYSIKTGEPYKVQFRIRNHATGEYRWFLGRALSIMDETGSIIRWLGTNTDIEEEKQSAEEMRLARKHLELMVESAQDFAIISMNLSGHVISWNKGAERIFGYAPDEIIGHTVNVIFTDPDLENGVPQFELDTAAQTGRAEDERWHLRKNGDRFYASGIMAAMYNDTGEIEGFTKIARDMTAQKNAEKALIDARNAAEAANIAKTEFLANMSHEIRTPMNAVIGLSNILATTEPLTKKQSEFIKTLQMSADSLLMLINDLLDISKIEARTVELEQIPFDVTQLVQEVSSMMNVRVKEKNLTFTASGEDVKNIMFIGDPTRLRQIVSNLCSNAIKFTEFGNVHVSITHAPTDRENIENIFIAVQDTGIGIAPNKLSTIFEKFIQADTSINRKYGGTGLGLAITKTLVEIMGGSISVTSKVGQGSVFTVCIPLPRASKENIQESNSSLPEIQRKSVGNHLKPVILLVEDYAPNVMVAETFLESFGYICDVASNGMEAVEKVMRNHYAAVLMDVQMHGMNGLQATSLIRENEKNNNKNRLAIIGMTAHALTGDRERCLGVGMDEYISKPFNPVELEALLQRFAPREEFAE